ncbi:hypothetical protein IE077_002751 [Cardiosporidium cionae]|uniref:5'-deoxynucleotidase n=1 Tax=Cardiosporidium cionae TaxID=476202 RepID=A0ABQ7J4G0_9APIC|nr:hypothetical protein IE077_002751 [Cardiosporidium cionae]|eukprot:KAF8817929.1 hypothetical protein IE077_002751 [Cardiosporidium cionae]
MPRSVRTLAFLAVSLVSQIIRSIITVAIFVFAFSTGVAENRVILLTKGGTFRQGKMSGPADSPHSSSTLIDFLLLCGKLKTVKRTGWVHQNVQHPESVSDHMYRMAMCSFLIPETVANREKCLKMALVHDLAESLVGDITPYCGISEQDKYMKEKDVFETIKSDLTGDLGKEIYDLWIEFEEGTTKEAQIIKDIDRFEMILQAFEYEKEQKLYLDSFYSSTKNIFETPLFSRLDKEMITFLGVFFKKL